MNIKNIEQLSNKSFSSSLNLSPGSTIYGKVISSSDGREYLKLFNGTILPVEFASKNNIVMGKYIKYRIEQVKNDITIIKALSTNIEEKNILKHSYNHILQKLNIPYEEGKGIIDSLIKFNLPATDENILKIYKNISFINRLRDISRDDIISLLKNYNLDKQNFSTVMNIISSLKEMDTDFLAFLIENNIPYNIDKMLMVQNHIKYNFSINDILELINISLRKNGRENTSDDSSSKSFLINKKELFNEYEIDLAKEIISKIPYDELKKLIDDVDVLNHLKDNYIIYNFNTLHKDSVFKHKILIKNKYKNSRSIDINDIKLFISVQTPNIGLIEGYITKKHDDISILFKVEQKFLKVFEKDIDILKNTLIQKGYNPISLSVEKIVIPSNIVNLSSFFNSNSTKELDVMV